VRSGLLAACLLAALVLSADGPGAQSPPPIEYELSFPEPHQRWMQVAMTVEDVPGPVLEARMSRSSPGRYALHEFAKNVWAVTAEDRTGRTLEVSRPNPHQWNVAGHDGRVTVRYRVYGDRVDGTYLAVDATHAHMNIPATLMFVRGLEGRPARVTLHQPPGRTWLAATQLYATRDPLVFTAPNLAYLVDSPIEFGEAVVTAFTVPPIAASAAAGSPTRGGRDSADAPGARAPAGREPTGAATIRVALHHLGTRADREAFLADVERIVGEEQALFGELPAFEPGHYTFLVDDLPWAHGDGMEHRNSTVITSPAPLPRPMSRLLGTVAHEFFHAWNVERIRPASLEPFDLEDANMSGELWMAEGFTSYAESLVMVRAGLESFEFTLSRWAGLVNAVTLSPAVRLRSAVEMSQLAPFTDAAAAIDRTNWDNTFLSYYTYGAALGLGLDLTLRSLPPDGSSGRGLDRSFDGYMRSLWTAFGQPGTTGAPGTVATPYTSADLRAALARLAASRELADAFFDRHVEGRQPLDWTRLFERAGVLVRKAAPGHPTLGDVSFDFSRQRGRVSAPVPSGSPASLAGLAQDDELERVAGKPIVSAESLRAALRGRRPGDEVELVYRRRGGQVVTARVRLDEDPRLELVPMERAGLPLSAARRAFRERWLASRVPGRGAR
jgi:predicted metalloprotease with PDZ domain